MQKRLVKTTVVDRSRWATGTHGLGESCLLNERDFQCCLGFASEQSGVPRGLLLDIGTPSRLLDQHKVHIVGLSRTQSEEIGLNTFKTHTNTKLAEAAMEINDDQSITNAEREEKLTALFKEHGREIVFEGVYGPERDPNTEGFYS